MDFFKMMEQELHTLGTDATVETVPKSMNPTKESTKRMQKYLSAKISENNKNTILAYEKATQCPVCR